MFTEIVTTVVIVGWIMCVYHSYYHLGDWETLGFNVGGFIYGVLRENIVALMPGMYSYPGHPFYIGAAPLMMGFAWSVTFYASWIVGNRLLEGFAPQWEGNMLMESLVAGVITALLAIPVEVTASANQTLWWIWPPEAIAVLFEMPAIVPFGWGGGAFFFILFYKLVESKRPEKQLHARRSYAGYFILTSLLVTVIHLVYTFTLRSVIVLLLGG